MLLRIKDSQEFRSQAFFSGDQNYVGHLSTPRLCKWEAINVAMAVFDNTRTLCRIKEAGQSLSELVVTRMVFICRFR